MQHLGINIKKIVTVTAISLLLSGCTWLNPLIYYEGKSGSRDTLPVSVEELVELVVPEELSLELLHEMMMKQKK